MNNLVIEKYFPNLSELQKHQFEMLGDLYKTWNDKINVISRKDIDNLCEHHILHSLGIAEVIKFRPKTTVLDVGTGGGFPGIPLAIMFPNVDFLLLDSIGKKITVATEVAKAIGLTNVVCKHGNAKEEKTKFDFIVSRAVMNLDELVKIVKKNILVGQKNSLPNGLICLKGGDLQEEINPFKKKSMIWSLSDYFEEDFFETKKVVYVPLVNKR